MNDQTRQLEPDANLAGQQYWRSLGEYAQSEHVQELLKDEFAGYDPKEIMSMSRRRFFQLMGAGMALAGIGLTGCRRWPEEKLAPFADRPQDRIPGKTQKFATMCERNGFVVPARATAFDGRPIKLAGNANHPMSPHGSSDAYLQAETLALYDPYRTNWVKRQSSRSGKLERVGTTPQDGWKGFANWCKDHFANTTSGQRIAVLHEPTNSPTFASLKARLEKQLPGVQFYTWSPVNRDNVIAGAALASDDGQAARWHYDLTKAKRIVSLSSDFLNDRPDSLKLASQWGQNRKSCDAGDMSRMYAVESSFTLTGSVAEHRLAIPDSMIPAVAATMAQMLGLPANRMQYPLPENARAFVSAMVEDLQQHAGESVVFAGPGMSPQVHALCLEINAALQGSAANDIQFATVEPQAKQPLQSEQIATLTKRLNAGEIDQLLVLGGNPVYDAPADLNFADAITQAETVIHLTVQANETSQKATWLLPQAHFLECWGDGRAYDGTLSIQQPLILPLFDGKSPVEVLSMLAGQRNKAGYDLVRETFQNETLLPGNTTFEKAWRTALHDGLVKESAYARIDSPKLANGQARGISAPQAPTGGESFEIVFQVDPCLLDGRYAGNGWLQETPQPMTKITWDNAALMNVKDAEQLGVETGNHVRIIIDGQSVELPVYRMPGQARGSIAIQLGYGRTAGSPVGIDVGKNVYPLRRTAGMDHAIGKVEKAGGTYELACTIEHHLIDGTAPPSPATESAAWALKKRLGKPGKSGYIVKENSLEDYKKNPNFVHEDDHGNLSLQLFPQEEEFREGPHAWGMTVDMTACIGCNGCVTACQAENNIPVVGRDQVIMSREMHWLRIDRYFKGDPADSPEVVHMPVACVHCENAPCEQVCPVAATVHDTEGLNTMVYNRCIGTRYCSNNCPYKVRRFNYFDYHSKPTPNSVSKPWLGIPDQQQQTQISDLKRMVFNPDVTVRMRGVMEKCTYCVQRIADAKSEARIRAADDPLDDGLVHDGDVVTACQEACPTQAITFGDLNDTKSNVSQKQKLPRAYSLLAELNTRPRTMHLAKIYNPNPKLAKSKDKVKHDSKEHSVQPDANHA